MRHSLSSLNTTIEDQQPDVELASKLGVKYCLCRGIQSQTDICNLIYYQRLSPPSCINKDEIIGKTESRGDLVHITITKSLVLL